MANYYSVIAEALSRSRYKTDKARCAMYDCARKALQEGLRTLDPPTSQVVLANELLALNTAICRVEADFASPGS